MAPKRKDYTGQKFGYLEAVRFVRRLGKSSCWLFRCDCGSEKEIRLHAVVCGQTKSCGCRRYDFPRTDYTNQRFGFLTALKFIEIANKSHIWLVKCDCGITKNINIRSVACADGVKSCGCLASSITSKRSAKDITGQRSGMITAVSAHSTQRNQILWKCLCDCGNVTFATTANITQKRKTSCGCKFKTYRGENHHKWKGGRKTASGGYIHVFAPDHPNAHKSGGYVLEHRLVMEQKVGRYLLPNENVHHLNGVRTDNRIENLELWVKKHPPGQRPEDLVAYSLEILQTYAPELYEKLY